MRLRAPEHQAAALERLLGARRRAVRAAGGAAAGPQVLVVASGKGGVGKTNLAVNLAVVLQQQGQQVLIVDADVGLGNVETLCGMRCSLSLADFLAGDDMADVVEIGPAGILCAAGGTALDDAVGLARTDLERLLRALLDLARPPTRLIVDLPAGLGDPVRSCLAAAGDILLVTTSEPTALADAYSVVKATCRLNPTVRIHVVVNQARSTVEARRTFARLRAAAARWLGVHLAFGGMVPEDAAVRRAVREQVPFVVASPLAPASRAVRALAGQIQNRPTVGQGAAAFFARLSAAAPGGARQRGSAAPGPLDTGPNPWEGSGG